MFYTYVLKSISFRVYYIGSCDNIEARLRQHNCGNVKSTKSFVPWKVVYREPFGTRSEAVKRERQLKRWKSRKAIERLFEKHF